MTRFECETVFVDSILPRKLPARETVEKSITRIEKELETVVALPHRLGRVPGSPQRGGGEGRRLGGEGSTEGEELRSEGRKS